MNNQNLDTTKLSPEEKRKLVTQLLAKKALESQTQSKCEPLSYLQQGLWSLAQLAPEAWTANVLFSAKIFSPINISALQKACQLLIDRHGTLRTNYKIQNGIPVQEVYPPKKFNLQHIDVAHLTPAQLEHKVQEIIRQPFDLAQDSVIKISLLSQADDEHILLIVVHHIAVDLWSLIILVDELRILYANQLANSPTPLPAIKSTYIDYVKWQAQILTTVRGEKLKQYWHYKLSGDLPVLDLPTDKPRLPIQTFAGASYTFSIGEDLTQQLRQLGQNQGASLYMVLLSAFNILLCRHSNQEEVIIGTPAACRNGREFASVVGGFINLLALRENITGNPTFITLLERVKHTVLEALQHQEYPFQLLTQELPLIPDPSRSPIFQAMFLLQKLQRGDDLAEFIVPTPSETKIDFGGLVMQPYPLPHQEGNHDITLEVIEANKSLQCIFKYNPLLFESETILAMIRHFKTLLANVVTAPQQPISNLSLLDEAELNQILVEWNSTKSEYPQDKCIHQLFEVQAAKTPDAIAVVWEEQQLTYQELNEKANQLAHYLQKLGVKPETLIGICVERSLDMIIGLLGILKAGGAYIPLDPNSPPERLQFILEDANIDILLTQKSLSNQLPENISHLLCLDQEELFRTEAVTNTTSNVALNNLIYIIYTSGSTGKPKGVEITHHNVTSLFAATESSYQFSATDKWTLFHSFAFDFAVWEIWGALIYGGTLVIVPYLVSRSPEQFYHLLSEQKITVLNQTPSAFTQLMGVLNQQTNQYPLPLNLRFLIFGGEKLNFATLKPWYVHQPNSNCQLVNMYGITEITVHATYQVISEQLTDSEQSLIGRPLTDLKIYILDRFLQPVPIGVSGELHIAGEGVARGYLNRPQLTATKFIENPFGEGRLYKTGDLARYLPDGKIEFLGRIDHQVKIRGFRIELGEIATVLNQHSTIRDAVVTVREDTPGNQLLIAYVVASLNRSIDQKELRSFLQQKLPDYMIPAAFVSLEAFPLTANGKVDLDSLPTPDVIRDSEEANFVAPRDELEHQLVQIWEKILGIKPIGISDNFFEIGGHSLLTVRLVTEIEQTLKQKLPIAALFQLTTVEQVANVLRQNQMNLSTASVQQSSSQLSPPESLKRNISSLPQLPIEDYKALLTTHAHWKSPRIGTKSLVLQTQVGDRDRQLPILAVGGMGDMHHHLPSDRPVYSLPVHTDIQSHDIYIQAVAAFYVDEILTIQPEGPYVLFGYCFGGTIALEIAQQLQAQGKEIALLFLVERSSFNSLYQSYLKRIRPFVAHWRQLSKLNFPEQKTYIWQKAQHLVDKTIAKFKLQVKPSASSSSDLKISVSNNSQGNENYEVTYTNSILLAQKNYRPKSYQGRVALYFSHEGARTCWLCPKGGWGQLIQGEIEVGTIQGSVDNLLIEPNVKILADKLNACLNKVSS